MLFLVGHSRETPLSLQSMSLGRPKKLKVRVGHHRHFKNILEYFWREVRQWRQDVKRQTSVTSDICNVRLLLLVDKVSVAG